MRAATARYLKRLRPPLDAATAEIERAAHARGDEIVSPDVARLLETVAALEPAGRVLELGTGGGYGTLHLARGVREGQVVTVDRDAAALAIAASILDQAGVGSRVERVQAEALDFLTGAVGPFHLVVVDIEPRDARRCVDLALPLLTVGGRLVVLRTLGRGPVGEATREDDPVQWQRESLHPYLLIHPQLAAVLLPIGEGVVIGVKRRPTIREMGGPF